MKMKQPPSKVGYFIKICRIFGIALTAKSAPKQKATRFILVFTVLGTHNFDQIKKTWRVAYSGM